jgi:hypothetical protein
MIDTTTCERYGKLLAYRDRLKREPFDDDIPVEQPRLPANALLTLRKTDADLMTSLRQSVALYTEDFPRHAGVSVEDLFPERLRLRLTHVSRATRYAPFN